jgi:hypothetical protein
MVSKKKVRNAAKVLDEVRYDGVGNWSTHNEKKQRCKLRIKAYTSVRYLKREKAF